MAKSRSGGSYFRLIRSGYVFRVRVPSSVRDKVQKIEIVRSLGTDSGRVARLLSAAIGLRIPELWETVASVERQNEVERLVQEWFQKEVDSAWRVFHEAVIAPGDEEQRYLQRDYSESQIEQVGDDWRRGRYGNVPPSLIEKLDCPPDTGSHAYALLASQTLQALGEIHEAIKRWADGKHDYRPEWRPTLDSAAFPPVSVCDGAGMAHIVAAGIDGAPDDAPTLGDAIDDYLRSIQRERNPTATDLAVF